MSDFKTLSKEISFTVKTTAYDEQYVAGQNTRATTNFANFARDPAHNQQRISTFLGLVNRDLNRILLSPGERQRYAIRLEILSIYGHFLRHSSAGSVLLTEVMRAAVLDRNSDRLMPGPTGLNFSSYLRDYDFRVVLPRLMSGTSTSPALESFGTLHGMITRLQFGAEGLIPTPLAIAISIAKDHVFVATSHKHPILGREYKGESASLTDQYFAKMGLQAQFFKPDELPAPLAFYSAKSLVQEDDTYLAALIAVMANFQRIYRPEIYLSRTAFSDVPGAASRASLGNRDFEQPALPYDREERELLADQQAKLIDDCFLNPYGEWLI